MAELDAVAFGAGPGLVHRPAHCLRPRAGARVRARPAGDRRLDAGGDRARNAGATRVVACIDARMREVYYAALEEDADGRWREVIPARASRRSGAEVPPGEDWIGAGSGFAVYGNLGLKSVLPEVHPTALGGGAPRRAAPRRGRGRRRGARGAGLRARQGRVHAGRSSQRDERRAQGRAASSRAMREEDLDEVMAIESAIYTHPWTRGNFADSLRAGYECRTWRLERRAARLLRADGGGGRSASAQPVDRRRATSARGHGSAAAARSARASRAGCGAQQPVPRSAAEQSRGAQALYYALRLPASRACGAATTRRTSGARTRSC